MKQHCIRGLLGQFGSADTVGGLLCVGRALGTMHGARFKVQDKQFCSGVSAPMSTLAQHTCLLPCGGLGTQPSRAKALVCPESTS